MKRRKTKAERKEAPFLIRFTDEQKTLFASTAKKLGLDLASWIRMVLLREASAEADR